MGVPFSKHINSNENNPLPMCFVISVVLEFRTRCLHTLGINARFDLR